MERITILLPAREPGGPAIIAATESRDEPARIYCATLKPGGRWEPQPMPEAWRQSLMDMGFSVPLVAP